jgi:hypothetical protein
MHIFLCIEYTINMQMCMGRTMENAKSDTRCHVYGACSAWSQCQKVKMYGIMYSTWAITTKPTITTPIRVVLLFCFLLAVNALTLDSRL